MAEGYWGLPGPSRFVGRIRSDVFAGKCILIVSNSFTAPGLSTALQAAVRENEMLMWRSVSLADVVQENPAETIASAGACHEGIDGLTPLGLAKMEGLAGCVFWIHGIPTDSMKRWGDFLVDYAEVARNTGPEPPLILMSAMAADDLNLATSSRAGLAMHHANDAVLASDTASVAHLEVPVRTCRLHRMLRTTVAVELAGSDLQLAERLARLDLAQLLKAEGALRERAAELGWLPPNSAAGGAYEMWHGRKRRHSAFEVAAGNSDEIQRRVWRAQVQALLPLVEDLRLQLIGQARHLLQLPIKTDFGLITEAEDLEVGPLHYLLKQAQAPRPAIHLARILMSLRNDLAHLRPVKIEDLLEDRLVQAAE